MDDYDLIVIGAGSGNMLFTDEMSRMKAAIVEPDRFGGTCLNRGCIPSKMLVVAADAALAVEESARLGVHARLENVDWPAIRARVFGRIDPLHERSVAYRRASRVDVFTEPARFIGPRQIQVGDRAITGEQIVVASGSRPAIPAIPGLGERRLPHVGHDHAHCGGPAVDGSHWRWIHCCRDGARLRRLRLGGEHRAAWPRLLMAEDELSRNGSPTRPPAASTCT